MSLYLIGGGGFAGEVLEALGARAAAVAGVFDDDPRLGATGPHRLPFLGGIDAALRRGGGDEFAIAIGDNGARLRIGRQLLAGGWNPVTVIHPTAVISPRATIEAGVYIGAFAFIGPDACVGAWSIVNVGVAVGHDANLASGVQLCPGVRVSGGCRIREAAFLGSNAVVGPGVAVGVSARLAAASFAGSDIPDGRLAAGVPARLAPVELG